MTLSMEAAMATTAAPQWICVLDKLYDVDFPIGVRQWSNADKFSSSHSIRNRNDHILEWQFNFLFVGEFLATTGRRSMLQILEYNMRVVKWKFYVFFLLRRETCRQRLEIHKLQNLNNSLMHLKRKDESVSSCSRTKMDTKHIWSNMLKMKFPVFKLMYTHEQYYI